MADLPQGQWFADCGVAGGWHLRWELGRANVYVPINQWGKIICASHQHCFLRFGDLQLLVNGERERYPGKRYGSKGSRERRELCEHIATYLNHVDQLLVTLMPETAP